MTNQEIKTVGQTIAQETQIGGNTAERVGGVIEGIGEALDNKDAAVGYYLATMSGSTIYINASSYRLGTGGNLRAKMPAAATTACTLTVGNAQAVQLWYNGAAVSADNSWEAGEIVTIFYDGTRFMASNSQGGGGQFGSGEKIKDILLSQVLGAGTDAITSQKGVSDAIFNEIDISSIDTLKTLNDALAPSSSLKPTYYTVTATLSSVNLKVGSMAVISDNMRHVVTEIMATHYILDDAGNLTNEHSDAEIFFIYRSVKLSGGTLPDPAGTWTKWRYVNSSVWSTVAEKIKYDNSQSGLSAENVQEGLDKIAEEVSMDIEIDLSGYNTIAGAINSQKKWTTASTSSKNRHILVPVNTNEIYKLATPFSYVAYAWLTSSDVSLGDSAPLVEGTSVFDSIPSNGVIGTPPPTTRFLYFRTNWGSADTIYPSYFAEIGTVKDVIGELKEDLSNIDNIIDDNSFYVINIGKLALTKGWLGANSYSMSDYGSHTAIQTNGASRMRIDVGSRTVYVYYAKTYTAPSSAVSPDFCDGYTSRVGYSSDTEVALPSDCQYVIIGRWSNQTDDNSPLSVSLNTFHDYVENKLETDKLDFAQGSYGSSGIRSYNTRYIRSNLFLGQRTVSVKSGYNIKYIYKWESENNLVSYITLNEPTYNIPNNGYYYSIVVNKSDNTAISPDEDVMDYDGSSKSILDYVIDNNLTRIGNATLNVIGDSVSNPDRSGYSASTVWWGVMRDLLGLNIGSYSCVSATPIGGSSSSSFHNRVKNMTLDGTITIIAGGMNDLGANNIPLGTFNYSSSLASQIEADATLTNSFIPAYRELIEYILTNNKNTRLYLCTITPRAIKKTSMTDAQLFFPWTNPSTHNNWAEFNDAIRKLAHDYGIGLIDWSNIGMYQQNGFGDESGTLPSDNIWTTDGVHPTVAYQKKMGELAASVIANTMF